MPSPRKVFPLRLHPSIRERLEQAAEHEGLSVNQLVARVLARFVDLPLSVTRGRTSATHEVELESKVAQRRPAAAVRPVKKQRQGEECACGSGRKFKHCHGRRP
jgi:hypothetical protein